MNNNKKNYIIIIIPIIIIILSSILISIYYISNIRDNNRENEIAINNTTNETFEEVSYTFGVKNKISSDCLSSYKNYVALGDSITLGTGLADTDNESFSSLIKNTSNCKLSNFGIDGMNTSWLLYDLSQGKYTDKIKDADLVTISIGSNDIFWILYQIIAKSFNIDISKKHNLNYSIYDSFSNATLSEKYNMLHNFYKTVFSDKTKSELDNAIIKYKKDFPKLISKIKDINSNAELIILEYYNPYHNVLKNTKFNKLSENYIEKLNYFLDSNTNLGYDVAYIKDRFYESDSTNVNFSIFNINFDPHPNKNGHEIIYNSILEILSNKK